jgi:hypothetical protein
MKITRAAALAGAVTIALSGCGGSSNKQLSYSDFISKANTLCKNGRAEFAKVKTPDEAASLLDKYVKKFKDLKPPDQLQSSYDRFVSVSDQQVALLKKGDTAGYNKLNAESDKIALEMGAKDCASTS